MADKKELLRQWRSSQKRPYLLNRNDVESLFSWLEAKVEAYGCDHTLKHTRTWLNRSRPETPVEDILEEIRGMGGYCDC